MRLTTTLLSEYIDIDATIKRLEARKRAIREAIASRGTPEFKMGDFLVTATEFKRHVPAHWQSGIMVRVKRAA